MIRSFLFFLFISSSVALFSQHQITIDDYMTSGEQTKTGVSTLNNTQKQALADWLSLQISPTPQQPTDTAQKEEKAFTLSENLSSGEILVLSDGSKWKIHPNDHTISSVWLVPNKIEISKGSDIKFPYILTNKNSKTSIRAQKYTGQKTS